MKAILGKEGQMPDERESARQGARDERLGPAAERIRSSPMGETAAEVFRENYTRA